MDILISEVGLRDGLQSIDRVLDIEVKKSWISAEAAAGVREIEVGSFVNYKALPQMAATAALVQFAKTIPGLTVAVLVPNLYGAKSALEAEVDVLSIPVSASETHSKLNVRRTHKQMIEEIRDIRAVIDELPESRRPHFSANVSTAFGCSIEGDVPVATVVDLAERMLDAGADEIGLSDTTGYADPRAVRERVRAVRSAIGKDKLLGVHLHNTRGLGLANALAALDEGITTIDSSLAGLGGCPAAPGASGNIVTEDLAFMLEAMGCKTGIDLEKLFEVRKVLAGGLPDEPLYGFVTDSGIPLGFSGSPQV